MVCCDGEAQAHLERARESSVADGLGAKEAAAGGGQEWVFGEMKEAEGS